MGSYSPVSIIQCKWGAKPFGLHVYMTEVPADSAKGNHALVDETTGFYAVQPDESVIFVLDQDCEWKVMTLANLWCKSPSHHQLCTVANLGQE